MRSHLLVVDLSASAVNVWFRQSSPVPLSSKLVPTFSSIRMRVSGVPLRSLMHLELSFAQVGNVDLFADFNIQPYSLTNTIC